MWPKIDQILPKSDQRCAHSQMVTRATDNSRGERPARLSPSYFLKYKYTNTEFVSKIKSDSAFDPRE